MSSNNPHNNCSTDAVNKNHMDESEGGRASRASLYPPMISISPRALCMLTLIPCIGSLLFGMDFGLTAWLLLNIETYAEDGVKWFEIVGDSDVGRGVVGSASPFGMAVGCLFATLFAEKAGRKGLMLLAALSYFSGSLFSCISGDLKWDNVSGLCWLLIGRLLYGLGNTFTTISVPAYLSETLPSRLRGTMLSCMELFIVVGIAVGFWLGGLEPFMVPRGWRYYFFVPLVFGIVMFCGVIFLPPSPRWLILNKGTVEKVAKALQFVNPEATEDDARDLMWEIRRGAGVNKASLFQQIKKGRAVAVAWKVSVLLVSFQQLTGQTALLYYSGLLFSNSLCHGNVSWALNLIGATKLAGALGCSFLVDECGRRKLLVASSFGMSVGMFFLAFDIVTKLINSAAAAPICVGVLVTAFYFYIFSYSLGLGPVTWVMLGELFPISIKSEASCWALCIGCALNVVVTLLVPILVKFFTFLGVFIIFCILCCICTLVLHMVVPETKGKTLEQIQADLETVTYEQVSTPRKGRLRHNSFFRELEDARTGGYVRRNTESHIEIAEDPETSPLLT